MFRLGFIEHRLGFIEHRTLCIGEKDTRLHFRILCIVMESGEVPGSGTIAEPSSSRPHEEKKLRPETPLSPLMAQECPRPPSLI
jgi:hypothetical protein